MNVSRLRPAELLIAAGGIALIASLFLDWFSVSIGPPIPAGIGPAADLPAFHPESATLNAWDSLDFIDYCLLLTGLVAIKAAGIRVWGKRPIGNVPFGAFVCGFGGVALTLVLWRILDPVRDASLEAGIWVALAATSAIGGGGYWAARLDGFDFYTDISGTPKPAAKRVAKR